MHFSVLYFSQDSSFYLYKSVGWKIGILIWKEKEKTKTKQTKKWRNRKGKGKKIKEHDRKRRTWQEKKNQRENFLRRDQQVGVLTLSQSIQNNTKIIFFLWKGNSQAMSKLILSVFCYFLRYCPLYHIPEWALFQKYSIVHILLLAPCLLWKIKEILIYQGFANPTSILSHRWLGNYHSLWQRYFNFSKNQNGFRQKKKLQENTCIYMEKLKWECWT